MDKYLQFGKYTGNCPEWLLEKIRKIPGGKIDTKNIEKILAAIRDEFDEKKYQVTHTTDFRQSRFISVEDILSKRQDSCGSLATVVAAVLRRLNVPTKLINGYWKSHDMRHSWNEVFIDGKWLAFDLTRKDFKVDERQIKKDEWLDWADLERVYRPEGS